MGRGNNFGLGSRDMGKAATFAMKGEARDGNASFSSAETVSDRFQQFAAYAKGEGLRRLEEVTRETVSAYGQALADQVERGALSASYAQNLVSAVNTVMGTATRGDWKSVSPTREAGIEQRSSIRETPAASADRSTYQDARGSLSERGAAVADLCRDLGLRSKESSLIDAGKALQQANERGAVMVTEGTKGGRPREVPITAQRQIETLQRAATVQGEARSMIPESQSWAQWRDGELRDTREALQDAGVPGIHDLRSGYASERYEQLTGYAAPVSGGGAPRELDRHARQVIAQELGHGRTDVTNSYLGSASR